MSGQNGRLSPGLVSFEGFTARVGVDVIRTGGAASVERLTVRKRRIDSEGKFGTDSADSGSDIKNYENNVKPDYF